MIDPRLLRDDPDALRAAQRRRGAPTELVDDLVAADERRRSSIAAFESVRAEQKTVGKQIAQADSEEKQALLAQTKALSAQVKAAEAAQNEAAEAFDAMLKALPNPASQEAPEGGEDDFVVLDTVGTPRDFAAEGFEPRDHLELGQLLGAIDTERGAKVSGARFYYLTGAGARLELALTQLAMSKASEWGFTPMIPPALVKPSAMEGTGFLGQAADDVYYLEKDDLYLVGTSEVALAAYHSDEILDPASLPLRYAGFSPCLPARGRLLRQGHPRHLPRALVRQGRDVRVHHDRGGPRRARAHPGVGASLARCPRAALPRHRRPRRRPRALGHPQVRLRGVDPHPGRYREVTSASNCTQFQARRLDIRTRHDGATTPVATLNGTLCAMTRTIVALLENGQQADGSVRLPAALHPLLGEVLEPIA